MNKPVKKLILIRGLPGSSKTTKALEILSENPDFVHFEADMFFMKDGKYCFDQEKLPQAHEWCINSACDAMYYGKSVIVANCFIKKRDMKPYLEIAKQLNYEIEILTREGNYGSIHDVPDEVMERMRNNFQK